jgi:hypothetical protein
MVDFMGLISTLPKQMEIPMICFCDIPLKLTKDHRKRYGNYAISLSKTWAITNDLSPVFYVRNDSSNHMILYSIRDKFESLKRAFQSRELTESEFLSIVDLEISINSLWKNVKPFCSEDSSVKYYDEREWRYIPKSYKIESRDDESTFLKFNSADVYQIVVTNSGERRIIKNLLQKMQYDNKSLRIKIK